jgi:hypothetical protein
LSRFFAAASYVSRYPMGVGTGALASGAGFAGSVAGVLGGTGTGAGAGVGAGAPTALGSSQPKKPGLEAIIDAGTTWPSWSAFTELSATA